MFKSLKELFALLTSEQRYRFYKLQVLVVLVAVSELLGVASIAPFMAVVGDVGLLEGAGLLAKLYSLSGLSDAYEFMFSLGVLVLFFLTISALLSIFTMWKLFMFATAVGAELANRLFTHYVNQNWLFYASGSTAELTKKIANESTRVTSLVILQVMQINARLVAVILLVALLFLVDPLVAVFAFFIIASAYGVLFKLIKLRLQTNGQIISTTLTERFKLMNEAFGGIKDILLLGHSSYFIDKFTDMSEKLAVSEGKNNVIAFVPKYFMELVAFGAMILLVLYMLATENGNLGVILPVLSLYALAGMKLLPSLQQIYFSTSQIKGNLAAFDAIKSDLMASWYDDKKVQNVSQQLKPRQSIRLNDISFTYPEKEQPALNGLTISIPVNALVGIVGPSGSGKSTAIDVLLGLIQPQTGCVVIDDTPIDDHNRRAWQNAIGFVPQSIFLSEGSIAENVAFGIPEKEIDFEQVKKSLKLAHLDELLDSLEQGIHTKVGERGVQLSGGQRQRIGIARALYHEADVLVFDEATSALDGITEKAIMQAIHDFSGQKTIVMIAHRLKTVEKCDQIYFVDQGRVVDQGSYQALLQGNERFRNMAAHA
jgi:HlyD family secretion protein